MDWQRQTRERETLGEEELRGNKYLYEITGEAMDSESREKVMVYRALYDDNEMFVRPYNMFMSEVDHEKYPYIKQKHRFEQVDE